MAKNENKTLTRKQEAFAQAFAVLGEGDDRVEIYRSIYTTAKKDASKQSIGVRVSKLLALPHVARRIRELRGRIADRNPKIMTKTQVLEELSLIAKSNIKKILNDDKTLKNLCDIDEDALHIIASVETSINLDKMGAEVKTEKIKLHCKLNALDKLAKFHGIYEKDNVVKVQLDEEILKWLQEDKQ